MRTSYGMVRTKELLKVLIKQASTEVIVEKMVSYKNKNLPLKIFIHNLQTFPNL